MAYAALVSLKQTNDRLLNSHHSNLPLNLKPEILFVCRKVESLQETVERFLALESSNSKSDGRIIDAIYKLDDALESLVSHRFLSESESLESESHELVFSQDLHKVKQEINSFVQTEEELYDIEVSQPSNSLADDDDVSSGINFGEDIMSKIVELNDEFVKLKDLLTGESPRLRTVSVVGMVGIGKTTLARKVYQDPFVRYYFKYRAWVTVGPNYSVREVLLGVLDQMDHDNIYKTREKSDSNLIEFIHKILQGRRYLIVLDDLWTTKLWNDLGRWFPKDNNQSRIMITTTMTGVAHHTSTDRFSHHVRFFNEDESWDLLQKKVFAEDLCPPILEKTGRKIAENCQGLPLAIITVGKLLSKSEKKLEYWNKVAENDNLFVIGADDDTSVFRALSLSYKHLPQHTKACFLYMGVFPQNYEISASKLMLLWIAEGFVEQHDGKSMDDVAEEILKELVSRGLVLIRKRGSMGGFKTCTLHYMFRHLCVHEAYKSKFFRVVKSYPESSPEGADNYQRRLCIHKNILFSIKDVYKSIESVSSARSLLCIGPFHQCPLQVCLHFRWLRVLDALTIRFYEFPVQILELVQLRYLGFTFCGGDLPASISRLDKLQIFIVRWHLSIKSAGAISYLPMEIWKMRELTHLQFMGSDLPDPSDVFSDLPNLLELSNVSAHSCTREVLSRIPNLKKLGILIELAPDAAEPLCRHLVNIATLSELESFKCVVTNPNHQPCAATLQESSLKLPFSLRKLTLSGCGFSWKDMRIISELPNLEVLKLQCYSFQGPEWEQYDQWGFAQLRFLLLEDLDVRHWRAGRMSFRRLERLIIRYCYKLEKIPPRLGDISTLQMIELVDCNPLVLASAECIKEEQLLYGNDSLQFHFHSSWVDDNLKS